MNYVEHHFGDYARDTAHLSMLEHGAYRLLMDRYYVREKPLPTDITECFRLVRASSAAEKKAVQSILSEFFDETPEGWRQKRCDAEIARFQDKQRKAKASAELRWAVCDGNADAMRTHSDGNAPRHQTPDTSNQTPEKEKDASATADVCSPLNGTNGAHHFPACPINEIIDLYHQQLPALPRITVRNSKRDKLIGARWRQVFVDGKAHDKAEAVELFRQFFDFVRDSKFLTGRAQPSNRDRAPFVADLEWLMSPTNFAKTVEGKYHR